MPVNLFPSTSAKKGLITVSSGLFIFYLNVIHLPTLTELNTPLYESSALEDNIRGDGGDMT